MLSLRTEADLTWFLSRGQSAFERSTMGPMLDRSELYRVPTRTAPFVGTDEDVEVAAGSGLTGVTARPTAELKQGARQEPEHELLTRYAEVSKRLSLVERHDPTAAAVLRVYYGDQGARWARTEHGRLFALYPMTPAAQGLLAKDSSADSPLELSPSERLQVLAVLQKIPAQARRSRRDALRRADREAEELYRAACQRWEAWCGR